jgi:hypothetical protein
MRANWVWSSRVLPPSKCAVNHISGERRKNTCFRRRIDG